MSRSRRKTTVTKREWEDLAQLDPLWAILTDNTRQFGEWKPDEFFASGRSEIDALMKVQELVPGDNGRVLDFGCGVGRLSRCLRSYFGEVYGVDISEEMVRLAANYTPSCTFVVNQVDDLSIFQSDFFDFVYSNIVLQHQRTKAVAKAYITEFVRTVKPGGTIVFQLPFRLAVRHALQPKRRVYSFLRGIGVPPQTLYSRFHLNPMRTISVCAEEVRAAVADAGGRLVRTYPVEFNYYSLNYVVTKDSPAKLLAVV